MTLAGERGAGTGEDEATCENGELIAVQGWRGGFASAKGRFVDHVVVEKGRDMDLSTI
jgi:hypothetical protein